MTRVPAHLRQASREEAGPVQPARKRRPWIRPAESVLAAYFSYTAALSLAWPLPPAVRLLFLAAPVLLAALAYAASRYGGKAIGIFREWILPALVLPAYWQAGWFQQAREGLAFERRWIEWDRIFLTSWHARAAIESLGNAIPFVLEFSYCMVYAIPAIALAILYRYHKRGRVDRFLFTLLLGTLATYALLPWFPSQPPRAAFPGQDLPGAVTVFRRLNVWLLDRYDIRTSVFPSGHVTAAFSAAFGMLLAFPEKKRAGALLLALAVSIAITTVYGRYHYAVDAIAGFAVSAAAAAASAALFHARRDAADPRASP